VSKITIKAIGTGYVVVNSTSAKFYIGQALTANYLICSVVGAVKVFLKLENNTTIEVV